MRVWLVAPECEVERLSPCPFDLSGRGITLAPLPYCEFSPSPPIVGSERPSSCSRIFRPTCVGTSSHTKPVVGAPYQSKKRYGGLGSVKRCVKENGWKSGSEDGNPNTLPGSGERARFSVARRVAHFLQGWRTLPQGRRTLILPQASMAQRFAY